MNPNKTVLHPDGDPDRHQNLITCSFLFTGQLPPFRENFIQIPLEVFCAKLLTDRQTDKQTNKQTTTITYPLWRRQSHFNLLFYNRNDNLYSPKIYNR